MCWPEKRIKLSNAPARVVIDAEGDLCLTVGDRDAVTFVVSSQTVARACPVWEGLLFGDIANPVQPGRDSNEKLNLNLPNDDPGPMKIILDIIHSRSDQVPIGVTESAALINMGRRMSFDNLYLLTVLTSKYDLTRHLNPWCGLWLLDTTTNELLRRETEHLCWIYWELGYLQMFLGVLRDITRNCAKIGGKLKWHSDGPELFSSVYEPPDMYRLVDRYRNYAIKDMLQPVTDVVEKLLQPDHPLSGDYQARGICQDSHENGKCEISMLESIVGSLSQRALWPLPKPEDVQVSAFQLAARLRSLDTTSKIGHACQAIPNIRERINAVLSNINFQLPEEHLLHLTAQAEKTGLSCNTEVP
ncbi:hypothetical protein GGR52DRAFT_373243 [Hypoxylon sp. FL1284]|nr:hypothetical protein GGR52DRAFT_373243 [Hypoxylon sp. FL1284]